jgi:hypothetical protein
MRHPSQRVLRVSTGGSREQEVLAHASYAPNAPLGRLYCTRKCVREWVVAGINKGQSEKSDWPFPFALV